MTGSTKYQQGSLVRVKNKTTPDTWFFRYSEQRDGRRVYRNLKIGTVKEFPLRRDAEKIAAEYRARINSEVRSPETVNDLITHYSDRELTLERKAHTTIANFKGNLKHYIAKKWGAYRLSEVKTVAVEEWLHRLPLAPNTRTKLRNQMSALFTHAVRYEFIHFNPISKVRCSCTRLRDPDVLTPAEFRAVVERVPLREQTMLLLAATTGLRRSEMFALKFIDICARTMQITITKSVVNNTFGPCKTASSRRPVPLHPTVLQLLERWRKISNYNQDDDFLFPSIRLNGKKPLMPDMVMTKIIRPAIKAAGITGKRIGWHSFRHSFATNLRSMGVDVKVAQELLRHSNSRITLDVYSHAVSEDKRFASGKQVELLLGNSVSAPLTAPLGEAA